MNEENSISEVTRRSIIDHVTISGIVWSGRLREDEFLGRLYDLSSMSSTDRRLCDAASDIRQHRVNWCDWSDDWVFTDPRFNLLYAPDEQFLRFLCETVHPVVRPEAEDAQSLVEYYNQELAVDGWRIFEVKNVSGKPVYGYQRTGGRVKVFEDPTGWQKVDRQIQEVRFRLDTAEAEEQFQTVGLLCRETLISVAQEVFDPITHKSPDGTVPSNTDAKRMIEAFIEKELGGASNEEVRAHARAALRLALALQHKRDADFKTAALCAEATFSVINIVAIIGGRRPS